MQQSHRSYPQQSNEESFDFRKYLKIVLKRKNVILITSVAVFVLWTLYVIKFQSRQSYDATTILYFQNAKSISAVSERGTPQGLSRLKLLRTRSFLSKVVLDLNLTMRISSENVSRSELFSNIHVDESTVPGSYELRFLPKDQMQIYYSDKKAEILNKLIYQGKIHGDHDVNRFEFKINTGYVKTAGIEKCKLSIVPMKSAIDKLEGRISYRFERRSNILNLTVTHKNPELAAMIANRVSTLLVEENRGLKRGKTAEVLQVLEEQHHLAEKSLDEAENALRQFKEKHPWVGLSADINNQITSISQMEMNTQNLATRQNTLENLLLRIKSGSDEDKFLTFREITTFLSSNGVSTISAVSTELQTLLAQRNRLLNTFSDQHPEVIENARKLIQLGRKIENLANNFLAGLIAQQQAAKNRITLKEKQLRSLPKQEVELARLRRNLEINDRIYSNILVKYNEAKIANQVEVGDISVIDEAVPPNPVSYFSFLMKKMLIGLVIGLGVGFGLAFVVEIMDRTVSTPEEAESSIGIPVIGSIPIIGEGTELPKFISPEDKKKLDPKLVTIDYSPQPIGEAYRSIRARLLFSNKNGKTNSILISSINPNEGKSLNASNIAITIAQQKLPTLLIDGDMRRGVLHNSFACSKKPGLADFLFSNAEVNLTNIAKIIQKTHVPNLFMISAGIQVPNPSEILGSPRMNQLIDLLKTKFGMVILDTPPLIAAADAVVAAPLFDSVLFVVMAKKTNIDILSRKLKDFDQFREKISGIVLNGISKDENKSQYHYTYYNY